MTDDRRVHPRSRSNVRILWSLAGKHDIQIDRLEDVSPLGARVATESLPAIGDEVRFDLLDEAGEKFATGLARVAWVNPVRGMGLSFLALGIEQEIVRTLVTSPSGPAPGMKRPGPPPLPGVIGGPPPLPGEHLQKQGEAVADPFAVEEIEPQIEPLAVRRTGVIIGIDLGTTNTCASYVVDGRPTIIPGRTGTNTIPSMITFDPDGTWYVGQRAADRQVLHPTRTVYGTKRLLGRTYKAELQAELQQHFAYPLGEADGHRFGVRIDARVISMDTIAARVLDEVRSTAQEFLKQPVEAAVITVPAYFSEVQREAVRRAAREANLVVHRIINEPTAAAVAYGHKLEGKKKTRVAVWDFGGGTFDFSIVQVTDGQLEVLLTAGDNFVGGSDFDDQLAAHLLAEFRRIEKIDLDPQPQQIARLRTAAEIAKRALSVQDDYAVELAEFTREPRRNLRAVVTRDQFDEMTKALVDRTIAIASEAMVEKGISREQVDDVLLVGGSTRIPAVQSAVERLFRRRPSKRINPDEAVALGAALLADEVGKSPVLLDILPMSVGYGATGCAFKPIVARHARLPASQEVSLDADFMGSVTLPLFQGESLDVGGNEYLCSVIVEDRTLWEKGKVIVTLSFDEHCVMAVEARDARTKRALPVRLDRARAVEEILRDLGAYTGPLKQHRSLAPPSKLGAALGKLFSIFGK